jgi:parallel beta-helix repeat protein
LEVSEGRWAPVVLTVTTAADSGPGSLRQAILDASAGPGFDTIDFSIGSGPQTITPSSPLPAVTGPLTIDGTSQPGFAGTPLVTLDGSGAGNGHGLVLGADGCGVWGLAVTHFAGCGVLALSSLDSVQGDFLLSNGLDGVHLRGSGSGVGGNLISGNARYGVWSAADDCLIQSNRIGTDAAGRVALPNTDAGVFLDSGPSAAPGVVNDTVALNLISGNTVFGVYVVGGGSNTIQGNRIGTDAAGTAALPNAGNGVALSSCLATTLQGNAISGNGGAGVLAGGSDLQRPTVPPHFSGGATIQGNKIGTDVSGSAALGNGHGGVVIYLGSNTNTVGGTAAGDGNVIAFNGGDGVQVQSFTGSSGQGEEDIDNAVEGNSIHDNARLGVNLVGGVENSFGVTANHTGTASGPNNLQNYPVLTAVAAGANGGTDVTFTLDSTASTAFRVEVFANAAADPSGFGEGQTFLGATTVTTDGSGHVATTVNVAGVVGAGQTVTATATDPAGNTSEFSADF